MHFHILSEDLSGKKALEILVPKIISQGNSFEIHSYKGLGSLPKHLDQKVDPKVETLLNKLPMILRALGKTYLHKNACVFVICDLDRKDLKNFRQELLKTLNQCHPKPLTRFCVAIEENEAWYLGDIPAIKSAYPHAKDEILSSYINDSICGTWEYLASATGNQSSGILKSMVLANAFIVLAEDVTQVKKGGTVAVQLLDNSPFSADKI